MTALPVAGRSPAPARAAGCRAPCAGAGCRPTGSAADRRGRAGSERAVGAGADDGDAPAGTPYSDGRIAAVCGLGTRTWRRGAGCRARSCRGARARASAGALSCASGWWIIATMGARTVARPPVSMEPKTRPSRISGRVRVERGQARHGVGHVGGRRVGEATRQAEMAATPRPAARSAFEQAAFVDVAARQRRRCRPEWRRRRVSRQAAPAHRCAGRAARARPPRRSRGRRGR